MATSKKNKSYNYSDSLEKVLLEFRIGLNKELYEDGTISIEVYKEMEKYLIKKLKSMN